MKHTKTKPGDTERRRRRTVTRDGYFDGEEPSETISDLTYSGYRLAKGVQIRPVGRRPKITDPGMLDKVCEGLVMGLGIGEVCAPRDMPSTKDLYKTMAKDPEGEVAVRIKQARDFQQDAVMDQIRELTDEMNDANYQRVSAQIRNLQWLASKLAPKRYGEKADPTMIDNRRQFVINITSDQYEEVSSRLLNDV